MGAGRLGGDVHEGGLLAGYRSLSDAGNSPGLTHGEAGALLVSWKLEPAPEKEERLFDLVLANARNPSHELFNGSPGTMLAALHLYEQAASALRSTSAPASTAGRACRCSTFSSNRKEMNPGLDAMITFAMPKAASNSVSRQA